MSALTPLEVTRIELRTIRDARECGLAVGQARDVVALAIDLYAAAKAHGISPEVANAVTSFPAAAVDAIRWRARAESRRRHTDG